MSSLSCWDVYHVLNCRHAQPIPKNKFVVIICFDPNPHGFFINSQINQFIRRRPRLLPCEVLLPANAHPFLRYDSWLDCQNLYDFQPNELTDHRGAIVSAVRVAVLQGVQNCPVLRRYQKRLILTQAAI